VGAPVTQLAIGVVNGVNQDFTTPFDYVSGTIVPVLNGAHAHAIKESETPPLAFRLTFAPAPGDVVAVYYQRI
jgi:hypothetical protein